MLSKQDYEVTKAESYCMVQSSPIQHIAEASSLSSYPGGEGDWGQ